VSINYAVTGGTATAGLDYTLASGSLSFAPGQVSQSITLAVINDSIDEPDETVIISLSSPLNAVLGANTTYTYTILDNDNPPSVQFSSTSSSGSESATTVNLEVKLSAASGWPVSINYAVTGGTATAGLDYTLASGSLSFAPGQVSQSITLAVIDDSLDETDETVVISLSNPVNATLGANTTYTYTILDNDNPPSVQFSSTSSSGLESVSQVGMEVRLSAASGLVVTVDYAVTGGTATGGGVDYILNDGTLTFAPGQTSKIIRATIINDNLPGEDEAIIVTLSNPSNATLGPNITYTYTILDDDGGDAGVGYANAVVVCQVLPGTNAREVAARHNMTVEEDLTDQVFVFGIPDGRTVEQAASELNADSQVVEAEPDFLVKLPEVDQRSMAAVDQHSVIFVDGQSPSDYFGQYALPLIRVPEAQAISVGKGVTVAVIDTGVDATHPAFKHVAQGYDFVDGDAEPAEESGGAVYGHGTMVAGIIALVAPEARIMPVRAFNKDGIGRASDVGQAIRFAARQGANVINMSFGVPVESAPIPIRTAIQFAARQRIVLIASAGNKNTNSLPPYPASDNLRVIAVAATDPADVKADFSNYGLYIDVCAPGVNIYSAYPEGRFAWGSGTSFAVPFVSGSAALVLSTGDSNAGQAVEETAIPIDHLNPSFRGLLGWGRIDARAAVSH
jgi:hypothetical protein